MNIARSNNRIRERIYPNLFASILLVAICIVPLLSRDLPEAVKLGVFFLWVLTSSSVGALKKNIGRSVIIGWSVYLALQLMYSIIGYSREIPFFLARCYLYVIPVVMVYVTSFYNLKEKKVLWYSIVTLFLFCLIHNFFLGSTGDEVFEVTSAVRGSNAGGTSFISGCLFIIPSALCLFRYSKSYFFNLFAIGLMMACVFYMLFVNTRTTVLLMLGVMMAVYYVIYNIKGTQVKWKKLIFRILIAFGLLAVIAVPLISQLSAMFSDVERMSDRLGDLAYVADGGEIEEIGHGSLYYRYILWTTSIETFLGSFSNFLFGVGEKITEGNIFSYIMCGVGNHSEIFDLAARYGILGIFIYVNMMRCTFRYMLQVEADARFRKIIITALVVFILYAFINNAVTQPCLSVMFFLFMPITLQLINNGKL